MSPEPAARWRPIALLRTAAQTLALSVAFTSLLGACSPQPAPTLAGRPASVVDRPGPTLPSTPSTDASLPSASSVFNAPVAAALAGATAADAAASAPQARAKAEMTPAEESRSMPMPGQANDHSVPVTPPKDAASR